MSKIPVRKYRKQDGTKVSEHIRKIPDLPNRIVYDKPDLGSKRWTMYAHDNGAWHERFTTYADKKPNDSETIKWLPYGEKASFVHSNESAKMSEYDAWVGEIYNEIESMLDVTRSDAQGIVDAQEFTLAQSWGKGLSPKETAKLVDKASRR